MSFVRRNLRALLAAAFLLTAGIVYIFSYLPARSAFEAEHDRLSEENAILQAAVLENLRCAALQPELDAATRALTESRTALYGRFPTELREEDQILYVLSLEERFGTEIDFDFGTAQSIATLSDGAELGALPLTVNYSARYGDFKAMVAALASDARVTSVRSATMHYDAATDTLSGELTLLCYTLADGRAYAPPEVAVPPTGKQNLFR